MVLIRTANNNDMPQLITLLKALFSIEKDFEFNEKKQRTGLQQMITNEHGTIFVAELDGHVIGMCSGQLTVSTAEGGPSLLVEDVIVADDFRSQGIGTRLMKAIEKWAQLKGAFRLQLLADKTNRDALDYYNKTGWKSTQLICLRKYLS